MSWMRLKHRKVLLSVLFVRGHDNGHNGEKKAVTFYPPHMYGTQYTYTVYTHCSLMYIAVRYLGMCVCMFPPSILVYFRVSDAATAAALRRWMLHNPKGECRRGRLFI